MFNDSQFTKAELFILKWQYHQLSNFQLALIDAIKIADEINQSILCLSFPDEVVGYQMYAYQRGWWQDLEERAEEAGFHTQLRGVQDGR